MVNVNSMDLEISCTQTAGESIPDPPGGPHDVRHSGPPTAKGSFRFVRKGKHVQIVWKKDADQNVRIGEPSFAVDLGDLRKVLSWIEGPAKQPRPARGRASARARRRA